MMTTLLPREIEKPLKTRENDNGGPSYRDQQVSLRKKMWSTQFLIKALCSTAIALWLFSPRSRAAPAGGCIATCEELSQYFGSAFHTPGNGADFVVWDQKQQQAPSACRVEPSSAEDIAYVLKKVVERSCPFAVKCGGHARYADDSVSVGGVTIDLVRMRSVEVSPDRTNVTVGAGHILRSLYTGLEAYNLSTTGGRVATVGLGGFGLGGGVSNFSPKYGLAVDNIFEYQLVLANASIITVNENTYPDIYFALRGGMNNFGVVAHFTMRAFPQGQMFSGSRGFAASQRDAVIAQAYKLTTEWKNDTNMAFSYGFAYQQASDSYTLSVTEAYSQPIMDPAPFRELNLLNYTTDTLRVDWMSNFSIEGASGRPPGSRNAYATISYYPSMNLDRMIQDVAVEEMASIKNISGFSPNVIFQPLYENAIKEGKARGGSALGIEADGPLTMVLLTIGWRNAEDDTAIDDFAARFIDRSKKVTVDEGKDHRWMYINYASRRQDPFGGYGQRNKNRLQRIQRAADPSGVFTSTGLCKGYFKLN